MMSSSPDPVDNVGITEADMIVYEPGQRRCGPPEGWIGENPGKGCEIFIAKIPRELYEKDLLPIFRKIGPVYMFRLMMESERSHRGFGFCVYGRPDDARNAVSRLNNHIIPIAMETGGGGGCCLGVCLSVDNRRLFVGGLPRLKSRIDILTEMRRVTGEEEVMDVIVYPSAADKSKNRGFAFVEYRDHKSAAAARKKMIGGGTGSSEGGIQLWGQNVAVDWAEPERKVDDEVMAKVKILYVRNLVLSTTEETIFLTFSQHTDKEDEIVRVKKIGDFAFVHFQSRGQAELVQQKMNGQELEGSRIEVNFAKPVNKLEQQQKVMRRKSINMMMSNELEKLSLGGQNFSAIQQKGFMNSSGIHPGRAYRNAAGRCSVKSRNMLRNFHSVNNPVPNNFMELLAHICQQNEWGTPCYTVQVIPIIFPGSQNQAATMSVFVAQVFIPGLNCHFPSKTSAFTHEDAIVNASESALQWMFYNGVQIPLLLGQAESGLQQTTKAQPESQDEARAIAEPSCPDKGSVGSHRHNESWTEQTSSGTQQHHFSPHKSSSVASSVPQSYYGGFYVPPPLSGADTSSTKVGRQPGDL